jgi:histidinol-phosphate phosphatase family protein
MRVRQAVILASRLEGAQPACLRPMADGRTFLDHLIAHVGRQGFDRALVLGPGISHGAAASGCWLPIDPGRGEGAALLEARPLLDERFLLLCGKTMLDANLRALEPALGGEALAAVAVRASEDEAPFALGAGLLRREALSGAPADANDLARDILAPLAECKRLARVACEGRLIEAGSGAHLGTPAIWPRPAVFFDRDGVLNQDAGYTHRPEDLVWMPAARAAVRAVNEAGWRAIVVTNQSGVARGLYDEAAVHRFHGAMQDQLAEAGAYIDAFYHCPFHPDGVIAAYAREHPDRKPNPGMILRALNDWPIDKARSVMIGDRGSDEAAARAAGVASLTYRGGDLDALVVEAMAQRRQ